MGVSASSGCAVAPGEGSAGLRALVLGLVAVVVAAGRRGRLGRAAALAPRTAAG
jgi:MYXO-CTERM domain-containing protein